MFRLGELQLIEEWATKYKHECEEHLDWLLKQPDPFGHLVSDQVYQVNLIDEANDLIAKVQTELQEQGRPDLISMDADEQGELIVLCQTLRQAWNAHPEKFFNSNTIQGVGETYYALGKVEEHLNSGKITKADLTLLEAWQEILEAK